MYTYGDFLRGLISRPLVFTDKYGLIKPNDYLTNLCMKVRSAIIVNSGGLDETVDFGGTISKGGNTFDKIAVKKYIASILDDVSIYLRSPAGKISYDMDNILIGSNILANRERYEDAAKVLEAGLLYNSESIADVLNRMSKLRGKATKIGFYIDSYSAKKYNYHQKYMMYMTIPNGYKCYLFEPENLVQMILLSKLGGMNAQQIQEYLAINRNGLLVSEIDMHTEGIVYDTLFRSKVYKMTGYFGRKFKEENLKATRALGGSSGSNGEAFFTKVLIGDFLALMDKIFYQKYNNDLTNRPEITEKECFINFVTPKSASVCLREDLDVNYVLPSLADKLKDVGKFNMLDARNFV